MSTSPVTDAAGARRVLGGQLDAILNGAAAAGRDVLPLEELDCGELIGALRQLDERDDLLCARGVVVANLAGPLADDPSAAVSVAVIDAVLSPLAPGPLREPGALARAARAYLVQERRGHHSGHLRAVASRLFPWRFPADLDALNDTIFAELVAARESAGPDETVNVPDQSAAYARALLVVALLLVAVAAADDAARGRLLALLAVALAAVEHDDARRDELDHGEPWREPDPPPRHLAVLTDCVLTAAPPSPRARAAAPIAA
ncbi:hypothetical protein [Krasilnikoviella flava]|uniref:Uncharacterized protein n=1 Tax=Krasilnikoviella flava TaxID=526729 RepID=A0A1T5LJM4_9MICO|nr:hypothetical protein [Krasilnikoviella flava]SKC76203.1 hypothetical protein SAMN04324258_3554 [Krasilnikoviella flava]